MKLTPIDKFFTFTLRLFLVFWAASGGPAWAYCGLYLLLTGSWGFCPAYSFFKTR